jgi:F5/8 type C domain
MRKRITGPTGRHGHLAAEPEWLDLARLAVVEVTSEDPGHPVESALVPGAGTGWRAGGPGEQTLRLLFDEPARVRRVRLVFREDEARRTQEFVLRWSADGGRSYREVVRQQYTFSPPGTAQEVEEYRVDLDGVTALELRVVPEIGGGGGARASLERMQVAAG